MLANQLRLVVVLANEHWPRGISLLFVSELYFLAGSWENNCLTVTVLLTRTTVSFRRFCYPTNNSVCGCQNVATLQFA
ncbi:hypothetical protein WN943_007330 [Citrus x changshan-huyou]